MIVIIATTKLLNKPTAKKGKLYVFPYQRIYLPATSRFNELEKFIAASLEIFTIYITTLFVLGIPLGNAANYFCFFPRFHFIKLCQSTVRK